MSFSKESEMYDVIAEFLKHERRFTCCETAQDKITFNLLKGWRIDVAGIIKKKDNYIVAVEAKDEICPESVLQAISQAEMYQKTCKRLLLQIRQPSTRAKFYVIFIKDPDFIFVR